MKSLIDVIKDCKILRNNLSLKAPGLAASYITLVNISHEDAGVYTCTAETGRAASGGLQHELTVLNATRMVTSSSYREVMSGARVVLGCEHQTDQASTARQSWSKDGQHIAFRSTDNGK